MFLKRLLKFLIIISCFFCLVAAIQTSAAIYFAKSAVTLTPADMVVVFPGGSERIQSGIEIVKGGAAPDFMVVNGTVESLRPILQENGMPESIQVFPGGKSRSTFEDAFQAVKTIKENQLRSVILVTSSYHLPRALFLLKTYLSISGQDDVQVQYYPVIQPLRFDKKVELYSNEAIKFWGSIIEMTGQYVTGQLLLDAPILKKMQTVFKKNLLL